jgi:hypothetical protein
MLKKSKLFVCLSGSSLLLVPLFLPSCSYVRPSLQIIGDGGSVMPNYIYHYHFRYKGLYVSNFAWDDVKFEFYDNDDGQTGAIKSQE